MKHLYDTYREAGYWGTLLLLLIHLLAREGWRD